MLRDNVHYTYLACLVAFFAHVHAADWWSGLDSAKTSVVVKPVADMLIRSAHDYARLHGQSFDDIYNNLPLSREPAGFPGVRAHQCLANEVIFDTTKENNECAGQLRDLIYGRDEKGPLTTYYTHSNNTLTLEQLRDRKIDLSALPRPRILGIEEGQKTVTLFMPWFDAKSGVTFSAGTRFVRSSKKDTQNEYAVLVIDYNLMKVVTSFIPKKIALIDKKRNSGHARRLFLKILHRWAGLKNEIPYVYGGSSFTHTQPPGFTSVPACLDSGSLIYMRPHEGRVKNGCDCSELIWRVADILGIQYTCKNTSMIASSLEPLSKGEHLKDGDIIWMPGHVAVVSNRNKNELIESTGYTSGYGKLLKIQVKDRLEGMSSYKDMISAYHKKKPLHRIEKDGSLKKYPEFKLLRLFKD